MFSAKWRLPPSFARTANRPMIDAMMPAAAISSGMVIPKVRSSGEISTIRCKATVPPGTFSTVSLSSVMLPHRVNASTIGASIEPT